MCGITGFLKKTKDLSRAHAVDDLRRMMRTLDHRGPDACGYFYSPEVCLGLAHTRLAIHDTSEGGAQPMTSPSGRYIIVFNGEIYNFKEIEKDIQRSAKSAPSAKRGNSDTEVLLRAIEIWGLREAVSRTVGMFSFAVNDTQERKLYLVRDRFGEKPLYYGWQGEFFVFGSELKSLRAHPSFSRDLDNLSVAQFITYGFIPGSKSIYSNVKKLAPGCLLVLGLDGRSTETIEQYWSTRSQYMGALSDPIEGDERVLLSTLQDQLNKSVARQMISDVPLGAFLSGGLDSSLICSTMVGLSDRQVKTFTIGFDEAFYDEAKHARSIATYLGTDHHEMRVRPSDALQIIPDLHISYDEPFGDASQLPMLLLSKLTKEYVTVAVSGDGGDELFGGYNRHSLASRLKRLESVPLGLRRFMSSSLEFLPNRQFSLIAKRLGFIAGPEHFSKLLRCLRFRDEKDLYLRLISNGCDPQIFKRGLQIEQSNEANANELVKDWMDKENIQLNFMLMDTLGYLKDDVLTKVDRASMASGLETRAPFLDHEFAQTAWRIPKHLMFKDGKGKYMLRRLLETKFPPEFFLRPKQGFSVPIGGWLRSELKDWASDLLSTESINESNYFDADYVNSVWKAHTSYKRDHSQLLWNLLMFQSWYRGQAA
jgi:asparagine synthase (glutamine-hydrolysing)